LIGDARFEAKEAAPLDIINRPVDGRDVGVGRLFNNNELDRGRGASKREAMKAAVSHLEQFMEKTADSSRGRIILATVKGDVH
jgi:5-methyltetrahydrofolate--homocysteine methyltransferase